MTKTPSDMLRARRETMDYLLTDGIRAAAKAAVEVCQDPKAPAPARATMTTAIFRAARLGGFGKADEDDGKELHEMTAEELAHAMRTIQDSLRDLENGTANAGAPDGAEDDIFG